MNLPVSHDVKTKDSFAFEFCVFWGTAAGMHMNNMISHCYSCVISYMENVNAKELEELYVHFLEFCALFRIFFTF